MSAYQRMVAKKLALFVRHRNRKGQFVCEEKELPERPGRQEVREEAKRLLQEILQKMR